MFDAARFWWDLPGRQGLTLFGCSSSAYSLEGSSSAMEDQQAVSHTIGLGFYPVSTDGLERAENF